MTRKHNNPSLLELFGQGRDAYNLVLGGMLGAYLGLTISRTGVAGGSYFSLGMLLLLTCLFVYCINLTGDRFHRGHLLLSPLFSILAVVMAASACLSAVAVQVDPYILMTIFVVWGVVMGFEIITGLSDVLRLRRSGP